MASMSVWICLGNESVSSLIGRSSPVRKQNGCAILEQTYSHSRDQDSVFFQVG